MANQNLFEGAIAEAKSVREVAILNAREALEESLTPHIKELLAAKLQEMEEEGGLEEEMSEDEEVVEEAEEDDTDSEDEEEDDDEEEAEDDAEESEDDAEMDTEVDDEEVDLDNLTVSDLQDMIRDIIAQEMPAGAMGDEDDMGMDTDMDMDMDMDTEPGMDGGMDDMVALDDEPDDENIDLEELMREIDNLTYEGKKGGRKKSSKKDEEEDKKAKAKSKKEKLEEVKLRREIKEARAAVRYMKKQLSEVNLLNSKLLYLNRVMKQNNLTESQKAHVISTFDRAQTVKEVKLVYETFNSTFDKQKVRTNTSSKFVKEHRAFASKPIGKSTKPENMLNEGVVGEPSEQIKRMQKLAGII